MFRQNAKRRRALQRKNYTEEINRHVAYPYRLNMYLMPPLEQVTVDEFEGWAIDRLKVLGELEGHLLRNRDIKELDAVMKPLLDRLLPLGSNNDSRAQIIEQERRKDHYSHFILRLAFCKSAHLRARFVRLESKLFELRFNTDDTKDRQKFIESLSLDWEPITDKERVWLDSKSPIVGEERYFKVDFEKVYDLVEQRKVVLHQGKAFVPGALQQSLLLGDFSANLNKQLEITSRALPRLDEDNRLLQILDHLSSGFAASEYQINVSEQNSGQITAAQVDGLVQEHFPLCMRTMHDALKRDHHLKYNGRQEYGLFLKGIGLSADEAVVFWRTAFSNMTEDKFNKEYRYNVRHQYGLEGSRINYRPHDCSKMINNSVSSGSGDVHGCPFRTFSPENLALALGNMGIVDQREITNITTASKEKHYHVACTRVYELTHQHDSNNYSESITHPNQYFDRSYKAAAEAAS